MAIADPACMRRSHRKAVHLRRRPDAIGGYRFLSRVPQLEAAR
jgi:hypothetical protein